MSVQPMVRDNAQYASIMYRSSTVAFWSARESNNFIRRGTQAVRSQAFSQSFQHCADHLPARHQRV
jgi:hypothetical protein